MNGLNSVLDKANRPWWGPSSPGDYLCRHPETGQMVGIGLLAKSNYSTFNLWYFGANQPCATDMSFHDSCKDIAVWVLSKEFGELLHQGYPLSEWTMVLTMVQFADLARQERFMLPYQGRWYVLGNDLRRQFDVVAPPMLAADLIPKGKGRGIRKRGLSEPSRN